MERAHEETTTAELDLVSRRLGALPVVNHFLHRAGLPAMLARYLPAGDARVKLPAAAAVRLVVTNLLLGRCPLYALGEWVAPFDPGPLALSGEEVGAVNDDRIGRALTALFDADRASLLTELVLGVVTEFGIDTSELHNDSTSISVQGVYRSADGHARGGQATPVITFGHSKDHRPDLKQLVWILTVAADGALPIAYRLADGNTTDDPTHIPTWDHLAELLGRTDFLYVADSKLASTAAMAHIHARGGRFVTVLPRSRAEDKYFRNWAQSHAPTWTEALRLPAGTGNNDNDNDNDNEGDRVYSTFPAPLPTTEGYRVIWVHSTAKAARDAAARQGRLTAGAAAIEALAARLAGPKCRLKTHAAIEAEATAALARAGATRWIDFTIGEVAEETYRQEKRGRPGASTRYRRTVRTRHTITAHPRTDHITYDAATDGCFPLVTNDTTMSEAEVLAAYRYQPHLERRLVCV